MRSRLNVMAFYIGVSFLTFSCVETSEFYDKDGLEDNLVETLGEKRENLELPILDENIETTEVQTVSKVIYENQMAGDSVVVFTDIEGIPAVNNESTLDNLLDQDILTSNDNESGSNIGDDVIPSDLEGTNNPSNTYTKVFNKENQTFQESDSTAVSTTKESGGEEAINNSDNTNLDIVPEVVETTEPEFEEVKVVEDFRPSQEEKPSQEGGVNIDVSTDSGTGNGTDFNTDSDSADTLDSTDSTTENGTDNGTDSNIDSDSSDILDSVDSTIDNGTGNGTDFNTDSDSPDTLDSIDSNAEYNSDNGTSLGTGIGGISNDNSNLSEENNEEGNGNFVSVSDLEQDFINNVEDGVESDQFICNPFEGEDQTSFQGITGFVYDGLSHPFRKVQDYYDFGKRSDAPIFMSEINVPTRRFDTGFQVNNGELVLNELGEKLFEYFALDLRGRIHLGDLEDAGHYQFAVLSDDGSIFKLEMDDNKNHELINNDHYTPTRMKCATDAVYFDQNTVRNFQMKYFQGPRMHISLMLLWRKVDPENIPTEQYCGKGGNKFFFDFNKVPSEPRRAFLELQERGWKVLDSQNYLLPAGIAENPCGDDQRVPAVQCFSEQVVLDERRWFYFSNDGIDMSSVKIEDENGQKRRYKYYSRSQKIKLKGTCLRGSKIRISYCMEKQ